MKFYFDHEKLEVYQDDQVYPGAFPAPAPQIRPAILLPMFNLALLAILAGFSITWSVAMTQAKDQTTAEGPTGNETSFGLQSHGLRCKLVPVSPTSDDESPDVTDATSEFARADDMTFTVELKNVSRKPVTLLGVRYGDSYGTAKGKLRTAFFAPHLFEFEFTDASGTAVPRVERVFERELMVLSGVSAHEVAPGDSLTLLLKPAQFMAPMDYHLSQGGFRARVRYRGPDNAVLADIMKHWRDSPQAKAWSHEVTSNAVDFSIAADPVAAESAQLVWGPVKDGLQAAIEFRVPKDVVEVSTEAPGAPWTTKIGVVFHVKNVGEKIVTFVSETARQGDYVRVTNAKGEEVKVSTPFYTGAPIDVRWKLKPGDVAKLHVLAPAVNAIKQPGQYTVRYTIRFHSRQSKDDQGNVTFPLPGDWQSELETGDTPLYLPPRIPGDDDRAEADEEKAARAGQH